MRKMIILAGAALLALSAMADEYVTRNGQDLVRLTDKPCPQEILSLVPPEWREIAMLATASIGGQEWRACWALRADGMVVMRYSDGDAGEIPAAAFRVSRAL